MLEKNEECKCNASAICTRKTRGQRADFYWFARLIPSERGPEKMPMLGPYGQARGLQY